MEEEERERGEKGERISKIFLLESESIRGSTTQHLWNYLRPRGTSQHEVASQPATQPGRRSSPPGDRDDLNFRLIYHRMCERAQSTGTFSPREKSNRSRTLPLSLSSTLFPLSYLSFLSSGNTRNVSITIDARPMEKSNVAFSAAISRHVIFAKPRTIRSIQFHETFNEYNELTILFRYGN